MRAVLEYLQAHPEVFLGVFGLFAVLNLISFYLGGRKAEDVFRGQAHQPIRFRERGASGYSNKSALTKLGGARGALDVIVTDAEVWIKGTMPLFSYIGTRFDMTHRIRRSQIRAVQARADAVDLRFVNDTGGESHVVLMLKDAKAFVASLTVATPFTGGQDVR